MFEVRRIDLQKSVPGGMTLQGLSEPRWDGANYFRSPQAPQSVLTFSTRSPQFVQLRYNLSSPATDVTVQGRVSVDKRPVDTFTFPRGEFITHEVGAFVPAGQHRVTVHYLCDGGSCEGRPLNQYWTGLSLVSSKSMQPREPVGLLAERWFLDAPATLLTVHGTAAPVFGGNTFSRKIPDKEFQLSWPQDLRPLNAVFSVWSGEPFVVTTLLGGRVVSTERGVAKTGVTAAVSLVPYPDQHELTVQIGCLSGRTGCADLYSAQLTVRSGEQHLSPLAASGGVALITLLSLLAFAWWLRLLPGGLWASRSA